LTSVFVEMHYFEFLMVVQEFSLDLFAPVLIVVLAFVVFVREETLETVEVTVAVKVAVKEEHLDESRE